MADEKKAGKERKQGILFVTSGTVHPAVRRNLIDDFQGAIEDRFPEALVFSSFTSSAVRTFLRKRDGEKIRDIRASLLRMQQEGVTDVAVISTHILEDSRYLDMREQVNSLAQLFSHVQIARPLLDSELDRELFARASVGAFSKRDSTHPLVFLTLGEKNLGNDMLEGLEQNLRATCGEDTYVTSLYGRRRMHAVLKELHRKQATEEGAEEGQSGEKRVVTVMPLMFLNRGMAGEEEERWMETYREAENLLEDAGFSVEEPASGLGEYDEFQRLYLRHLLMALREA